MESWTAGMSPFVFQFETVILSAFKSILSHIWHMHFLLS